MARNSKGSSCRRTSIASFTLKDVLCSWMVAALVLIAGKASFPLGLAPLRFQTPKRHLSSLVSKMASSSSSIPKLLEVEQKFPFSDRSLLEERLRKNGFAPVKELTMVDWYFDRFVDDANDESNGDLELPLIRRDHWLRYRETGKSSEGQWQLKRGNQKSGGGGGATVYEEIEGTHAVEIARSVLQEHLSEDSPESDANQTFDGHSIPVLPISDCDVVPFARIVTHRAKWKQNLGSNNSKETNAISVISDLVVDLDTTPDGFAVGEVEAVVEGEDCSIESAGSKEAAAEAEARNNIAVARARENIQEFLASLLEEENGKSRRPPMGKLEQFLSTKRPQIYNACVESGVIPKPRSSDSATSAT